MAVLLYCLTLAESEPVKVSAGFGEEVRPLSFGPLRAYVSDIDPETRLGTPEAQKKSTMQFNQVLREILAVTTLLPFRFPTMADNEDSVAKLVAERESDYEAVLRRLAGTVQYEVVASWDEQPADTATPVSGAEYRKRREQELARVAGVDEKLRRVTGHIVREWRQRRERKAYRWFGLLERDRREEFLTALRSAGPSAGVRVRLSGPWPPSEFVEPFDEPSNP